MGVTIVNLNPKERNGEGITGGEVAFTEITNLIPY